MLVLLAVLAGRMNVMTIPYEVNLMQINDLYPLSSHHLKHRILLHFETELKPKLKPKTRPIETASNIYSTIQMMRKKNWTRRGQDQPEDKLIFNQILNWNYPTPELRVCSVTELTS